MGILVEFSIVDKDEAVFQMREFKPSLGFDRTRRVLVIVGACGLPVLTMSKNIM